MLSRPSKPIWRLTLLALNAALVTAGPCDIYASGNTPCIAAHATTRALYSSYTGALYQLTRGSDNTSIDVHPLSAGSVANAGTQDSFCASTTCLISVIYDQSGRGNHLYRGPNGAFAGPYFNGDDDLAGAYGAPVTLNGKKAYGVFISPGTGYRNNKISGSAVGDAAEGMYAVFDGTHYNGDCCFDYGNAETNSLDTGNGHMEALYFGEGKGWGPGSGKGPWVMADLENGLYAGSDPKGNGNSPTITSRFVTTVLKGDNNNHWAIRGGDSNRGGLTTYQNGVRPPGGYNPMQKEGAIILGIGGDNSHWGQGTFYEGVMTSSYPSDETENKVQADIVAQNYAAASRISGPAMNVGSTVSLRVTTAGFDTRYLAHTGQTVNTQVVSASSEYALKASASWKVRPGLGNSGCYSFESVDSPNSYIRHYDYTLRVNANDGSKQFGEDATWCPQTGLSGSGTTTVRSWSYPARFFRHFAATGYLAANGGVHDFDNANSFNADASWAVSGGFV